MPAAPSRLLTARSPCPGSCSSNAAPASAAQPLNSMTAAQPASRPPLTLGAPLPMHPAAQGVCTVGRQGALPHWCAAQPLCGSPHTTLALLALQHCLGQAAARHDSTCAARGEPSSQCPNPNALKQAPLFRLHPRLRGFSLTAVLIDEAGQASEVAALQPLVFGAKRYVVAGVHACWGSTAAGRGGTLAAGLGNTSKEGGSGFSKKPLF